MLSCRGITGVFEMDFRDIFSQIKPLRLCLTGQRINYPLFELLPIPFLLDLTKDPLFLLSEIIPLHVIPQSFVLG